VYVVTVEPESSNAEAVSKPSCVAEWVVRYYN
jgi:hypothetical protein